MSKKSYCKITWNDFCELDYGHTVCEFKDLEAQIQAFEFAFQATEENTPVDELPSFEVSIVFLTEEEFAKEIESYEI